MNIYLIESSDYIIIKECINNILIDNNLCNDNVIKYDLSEVNVNQVIEELDTYSFLIDRKVVIIDNVNFLSSGKIKEKDENDLEIFSKYLNNPSKDNILVVISDKLDGKKNAVKLLRKVSNKLDTDISINKLVKKRLDGFKMEDTVIKYFVDYCGNDNEKILTELEKLKCYKINDKVITYDDIDLVVLKSSNDNIFSLVDAIMARNKKKAINFYKELIKSGEDSSMVLSHLQEQFRIIYNGKILMKEYNSYQEVASLLGIHPYRLQKAIESSYTYSDKDILKFLNELDSMEIGIKTGKGLFSLEVFIYSL